MGRRAQTLEVANDYFSLSANGGVPRWRVIEILRTPRLLACYAKNGRCMLCRAPEVDATALCTVCSSFLSDEEREAARVYHDG